jgi:hypothetical protein
MFIIDILKETGILFLEMAPYLMLGLFFVGLMNLFFNKDLIIKYLGKDNFWSVLKAAIFGIPLPLCSCGVIPSAVYMSKNGASKSSVVSFLIATPQTGIDSIIATYGMLGWIFAIFRPFAALFMGVIGGTVVGLLSKKQDAINDFSEYKTQNNPASCSDKCSDTDNSKSELNTSKDNKFKTFFNYSFVEFLDDISVQFVIGLLISGLIAYLIPDKFFEGTSVNNGILGMLLMIAIGVPMYICATASIPIAVTLMMKGFSPGVAFVFLAVGPATNAASLTILSNVLGKKITAIYVIMISVTAILFGLLLDQIFVWMDVDNHQFMSHIHNHGGLLSVELQWFIGAVFMALLLASLYRKLILSKIKSKVKKMDSTTIKISGMSCNHCVANVKKVVAKIQGVTEVDVNLEQGEAYIKGKFDLSSVESAIIDEGYKVVK